MKPAREAREPTRLRTPEGKLALAEEVKDTHLLKRVAPPKVKRCRTLYAPLSVSSSEGASASTASF